VKEERSAGAVLFRREDSQLRFLLLHYTSGHFDWPKGNIEEGESEVETVLREVREETGLQRTRVIPGFREEISYFYRRQGSLVRKTVVFYLAEAEDSDVKLSHEHIGYRWLDYEGALKTLTYENSRSVLRKAKAVLDGILKTSSPQ
jgi:8-oxo-dGTP pyrophosphatase MutT (NUDIX family)